MTRIYSATPPFNRHVRYVKLEETYRGSCHWRVYIEPEGYGENSDFITFCAIEDKGRDYWSLAQKEGYGIFRIEIAAFIARSLTGATGYETI